MAKKNKTREILESIKELLPVVRDILHTLKEYAFEFAMTIVFIAWLGRAVWHELGL